MILVNTLKICCLFVCLLQRACNFGKSFEKCYPENFDLFCFFLCLIVCCFDVPFSIGQRRAYIIPCTSVDELKTACSAEGLSEPVRILHHTLQIFIKYHRIFRYFMRVLSDTG